MFCCQGWSTGLGANRWIRMCFGFTSRGLPANTIGRFCAGSCMCGRRAQTSSFVSARREVGNEAGTRGRLSRDRAKLYGAHKTIYNRFARWSERGIWPNNASASSRASKTFWPISSPARRASRAFDAVCSGGHDTDAFRVVLKKPKKRSVIRAKSNVAYWIGFEA